MKKTILPWVILGLFCASKIFGQSPEFLPGGTYNPDIPSPKDFLGYQLGSTFTRHDEMEKYIFRLAELSDRIQLQQIGRTNERRGLYLLTITSPENQARIEQIRAKIGKLADPRLVSSNAEVEQIIANTPAVVWLNYGIHGDESAAFETAMQVAYQLASGTDSLTQTILQNVVTLINMCHNPDSHERFVAWYNGFKVGKAGTADPNAAEHHDPWGWNTVGNHYQIDLNRDWFIASQVETQAVQTEYLRWQPQVLVDHHGETDNYFFGPQSEPINKNIPQHVRRWFEIFAQANAKAFDQFGWSYFGEEEFDEFYPGYSSAWACLNGAVGMTYETDAGGDRGLQVERWDDGTKTTLLDGIRHHFMASITTLATTAQHREQRLRDFYDFKKSAIADGQIAQMRRFIFLEGPDPLRTRKLIETLLRQGIEVHRATAPFQLEKCQDYFNTPSQNRNFPSGTFIVEAAQPQKRLLTAILEPEPFLNPTDTLTSTGEWSEPYYDLTAWALPFSFNVETYWSADKSILQTEPVLRSTIPRESERNKDTNSHDFPIFGVQDGPAEYAYIFSYQTNAAAKLLARLLQSGYVVMLSQAPFQIAGRAFQNAAIIVRAERNRESLHEDMAKWSKAFGVEVQSVHTGWSESGIKLGSPRLVHLEKPRIAVVTGPPVNTPEYGAVWYLLEKEFEIEFTAIQMQEIKDANLRRYNLMVFPDDEERWAQPHGKYFDNLGQMGIEKLRRWIEDGGTFVGISGGALFALSDSLLPERAAGFAQTGLKIKLEKTPGTIFQVLPNSHHLLAAGFDSAVPVLVRSSLVFSPAKSAENVFSFPADFDKIKLSGVTSADDIKACAGAPYLLVEPVEHGRVILFADDPTFRLAWHGLFRLFLNAVLLGPSAGN